MTLTRCDGKGWKFPALWFGVRQKHLRMARSICFQRDFCLAPTTVGVATACRHCLDPSCSPFLLAIMP